MIDNKGTLTINGGTFKVTNGTLKATTNSVRLVNFGSDYDEIDITIKDGVFAGGFGEKITRFYGNSDIKVLNFGAKKEFTDRVPIDEL